jgi:hypothetical protein
MFCRGKRLALIQLCISTIVNNNSVAICNASDGYKGHVIFIPITGISNDIIPNDIQGIRIPTLIQRDTTVAIGGEPSTLKNGIVLDGCIISSITVNSSATAF